MKELIDLLQEKAGITEAQATKAATTVSEYIKGKMPAAFQKNIEAAFNGQSLTDGIKDQLEDLTGSLKENAEKIGGELKENAEKIIGDVREKLSGLFGSDKK